MKNENSSKIFGLPVPSGIQRSSFQVLCQTLLYSDHEISWIAGLLPVIKTESQIAEFLVDFNEGINPDLMEEVNFTNYQKIQSKIREERVWRLREWSSSIGQLTAEEVRGYANKFKLGDMELKNLLTQSKPGKRAISPAYFFQKISESVIGQPDAVKSVSVALYLHYLKYSQGMDFTAEAEILPQQHILFVGPSGTGKSHLTRVMAKNLPFNAPLITIDGASSVKSGIVGNTLSDYFQAVYNTGVSLEELQYAIVVIDEFDKLANAYAYDRKSIQTELLNIMGEGGKVSFEPSRNAAKVTLSCDKMLFILCGAFQDLRKEKGSSVIGFNRPFVPVDKDADEKIDRKSLIEYGFIPELVNRIHRVITLKSLTVSDFVEILRNSASSPLLPFKNYFRRHNTEVEFTEGFIEKLAMLSYESNANGRGPAGVLSEIMDDVVFSCPNEAESKYVIDESFLEKK